MNPLSAVFREAVRLRNRLYDRRFFKVNQLGRPVVSIGNLSVGGSGKTPFVIALGRLLQERGIEFDVLTRGYGRRSSGIAVVDPQGTPQEFGDEPLLIARQLRAPVVVGADRFQAGLLAEKQFPDSKLHLLDDGFQHRALHRDFDIVLLSPADMKDTLLPIGRLREPFSSLRRADAVVLAPDAQPAGTLLSVAASQMWRARRNIQFMTPMARVVAFCGIARPQQFFAGLRKLGMELAATIAFGDHHHYRQSDIRRLLRAKARTRSQGFITTEKDAINLGELSSGLRTFEIAGLELELEEPSKALETMLGVLEQRRGCRFSLRL